MFLRALRKRTLKLKMKCIIPNPKKVRRQGFDNQVQPTVQRKDFHCSNRSTLGLLFCFLVDINPHFWCTSRKTAYAIYVPFNSTSQFLYILDFVH